MQDRLGKYLARQRIEAVLPALKGRLLDIGCGYNQLVKAWGIGTGVDVFNWPGVDLVVEDASELPFKDGEFDTVSIVAALNHIPNREAVLKEAHRVLSSDGRIVVTMITPLVSAVWHRLRAPWDDDQSQRGMRKGEVYGFYYSEMIRLFQDAGFELESRRPFMLRMNSLYIFSKGKK